MTTIDREFYASYIYDEYKSVHGVRPRWMDFDSMSDAELVRIADDLEAQIINENSVMRSNEQIILMAMLHPQGVVSVDFPYFDGETVEDVVNSRHFNYDVERLSAHFYIPENPMTIGDYCGRS